LLEPDMSGRPVISPEELTLFRQHREGQGSRCPSITALL
jgi:hypothetical protein